MSVSGTFRDEPCGTGEEGVRYDDTATWSGTLQFDEEGIVVTYTEEPDNQVLFDVNTGHWQETSTDYIQLEDDLYTIYEAKITDNAYRPADPAHPGLVFIGWTTNADIAAQRDFSTEEAVTWGSTTIIPDEGGIALDKVREEYLWDFSQPPPYEQTLYAVWSDKVSVVYNMMYSSVFYRSQEDPRYVIWSMAKGDRATKPENPSPHSERPNWNFITWLEHNAKTDGFRSNDRKPSSSEIADYGFDFSQRIMETVTLVTSWTSNKPQHFTFTVEKRVVDGNPNDEFTFNVEVLDELVYGKITSSTNTIGPPARRWGSAAVRLKNNQQYTVNVTVSYIPDWDGAYGVGIEVTDANGAVIRSGQVIYCEKNTYKNFVSDYQYTLKISEEAAAGYDTEVTVEDMDGEIVCDTSQEERAFSFTVHQGSRFAPARNDYTAGADNSLRIVFTNTGEPIIAPTGVRTGLAPFALMMLAGLLLAAGIILPGRVRKYRQGKAAQAEETAGKQGDPVK